MKIAATFALFLSLAWAAGSETLLIYKKGDTATTSTPRIVVCSDVNFFPAIVKATSNEGKAIEIPTDLILLRVEEFSPSLNIQAIASKFPNLSKELELIGDEWAKRRAVLSANAAEVNSEPAGKIQTLTTLDGQKFTGKVTAKNNYLLTVWEANGVSSVPVASLDQAGLKEFNQSDRKSDERFWFERATVLCKAQDEGLPCLDAAMELSSHMDLVQSWGEKMRIESEIRTRTKAEQTAQRSEDSANQQTEIESLLSLTKLGYNPTYDPATRTIYVTEQDAAFARQRFLERNAGNGIR